MTVFEIMFYRRTVDSWEFTYNKLFQSLNRAAKYLRLSGFKLMEDSENLYQCKDRRAVLVEKEVE